jgi:IS66 C-terminal element
MQTSCWSSSCKGSAAPGKLEPQLCGHACRGSARVLPASASVGDMFTSLIHTAKLRAVNPFEYLTEVLRHAAEVAAQPRDWLPSTYKATLARLSSS